MIPVRCLDEGLVVTEHQAWAWFTVPTCSYELLSQEQRLGEARALALGISALHDAECHLLVTHRPGALDEWADALDEATPQPRPGWEQYLAQLQRHLAAQRFVERRAYLGVALGARHTGWRGRRRDVERLAGVEGPPVGSRELDRWQHQSELTRRTLSGSGLVPAPASVDELRWLLQSCFHRGLPPPPLLPAGRVWGGALRTLGEGRVVNGRHGLRIEQPGGTRHLALLSVARLPEALLFPGHEWLYATELLGNYVDASVRFRVVPARLAAIDASRKVVEALDQARNIGTPEVVPAGVVEMAEQARELEHALTRDGLPLLDVQTTLCVAAASADELEAAVVDCIELYRDMGIELARPSGEQLALFAETLPGERWRTRSYLQRMPAVTLSGGMPHATSEVGDRVGPYIGHTTGATRTAVHFDPLRAARDNLPTGVAVTGAPGGGKTTLAQLLAYQMTLRGAWVLVVDPKGDSTGIGALPGIGRSEVVELGPSSPGVLDPFRLAEDAAQAALLAADTCRLLLPGSLNAYQEAVLVQACRDVAGGERRSLGAVRDRLLQQSTEDGRRLGSVLAAYADVPAASLCFAPGPATATTIDDEALRVVTFRGLSFPTQGTRREDYSLGERLAVAVLHLVTALAARLADEAPAVAKAVVLDEAWALTASSPGRALVESLARTGRSKNLALVLISQNAGDFLDERITNCFSARFAFRSTQEDEIRAVLKLLELDATAYAVAMVRALGNGECIVHDAAGRIGVTKVDLVLPVLADAFDTTPPPVRRVKVH